MLIGELAEASGVGVETLRFYEREGLFPEPPEARPDTAYTAETRSDASSSSSRPRSSASPWPRRGTFSISG